MSTYGYRTRDYVFEAVAGILILVASLCAIAGVAQVLNGKKPAPQVITASALPDTDTTPEPPRVDTAELHCLASTLFGEAGTEPELGKVLVAITVMNRVALDRYPDSICGVVSQPRQFAGYRSSRSASIYASKAWEESLRVSREVMGGAWRLGTCGTATHFDGVNSRARWIRSPRMIQLCHVNNHVFYLETTQ